MIQMTQKMILLHCKFIRDFIFDTLFIFSRESHLKTKKIATFFAIRTIIRGKIDLHRTKLEENQKLVNMDSY